MKSALLRSFERIQIQKIVSLFEWINMAEKMRFILNVNKIEQRWIWHWQSSEYVHRNVFECAWLWNVQYTCLPIERVSARCSQLNGSSRRSMCFSVAFAQLAATLVAICLSSMSYPVVIAVVIAAIVAIVIVFLVPFIFWMQNIS